MSCQILAGSILNRDKSQDLNEEVRYLCLQHSINVYLILFNDYYQIIIHHNPS